MRHPAATFVSIVLMSGIGQAWAQTTEMWDHIYDLGRQNEKLQERVQSLENENSLLRERLRQLEGGEPKRVPAISLPIPVAPPRPSFGEQGPAPRIAAPSPPSAQPPSIPPPSPSPSSPLALTPVPAAAAHVGTIDFNSDPPGAKVASHGSGCETPCAMEISADGPFTVTFTRSGYAPASVQVRIEPGQPGVSDPRFAPNPVFVQLKPQAQKKPPPGEPQKLAPAR